jgi:hypothetical protein
VNSDLSADIRSLGVGRRFGLILCCNENQEVTSESFGNKGGCKTNVVLIDLKHGAKVPFFEVGKNASSQRRSSLTLESRRGASPRSAGS